MAKKKKTRKVVGTENNNAYPAANSTARVSNDDMKTLPSRQDGGMALPRWMGKDADVDSILILKACVTTLPATPPHIHTHAHARTLQRTTRLLLLPYHTAHTHTG